MTDIEKLRDAYAKLQSKCQKQRNEIGRLTREVQGVRDDLVDIRVQRDTLAARLREIEGRQREGTLIATPVGPGF